MLHGLLGRGRNWQGIAKALEPEARFALVDLRNHGASPWSDRMDYPAMAADVAALIRAEASGPVRLIGHSMGGKAAMLLALLEPTLVDRLLVVDIAPVTYAHDTQGPMLDAMAALDLASFARRSDADVALAPAVPDAGMRGFLLQNLEQEDGRFRWRANIEVLRATLPVLKSFEAPPEHSWDGPTLAVRGARSDYVTAAHEAALRDLFPKAQVSTVEGAGHWPHSERPAVFIEKVRPFLLSS
ncbi:MAG: alpha/beta fold hydrolase [Geminicoccaceae bacterium]